MTTETAQSNEERVRAVWVTTESGQVGFILRIQGWDTEAEAWAAAWEYTEAALGEVRNIGEEISATTHEFKKASVCGVGMGPLQGRALVWSRILARLQSLLATKTAGMKPEAL